MGPGGVRLSLLNLFTIHDFHDSKQPSAFSSQLLDKRCKHTLDLRDVIRKPFIELAEFMEFVGFVGLIELTALF